MPLKYQDVVNNPEYKDKLDKLNQKRIDRLQSEYDKFALTGSRDSGDKTLRTSNGTVRVRSNVYEQTSADFVQDGRSEYKDRSRIFRIFLGGTSYD